jgi:predicted alpha/beta superfamily hydrolase
VSGRPSAGTVATLTSYLPRSYRTDSNRRYPVVYMQDGQNLSDPTTSVAGTWELEAALERLETRGLEAIVVGIQCRRRPDSGIQSVSCESGGLSLPA